MQFPSGLSAFGLCAIVQNGLIERLLPWRLIALELHMKILARSLVLVTDNLMKRIARSSHRVDDLQ